MRTRLAVLCAAILLAGCAAPQNRGGDLNVPRDLSLGGKTYQLAFKDANPRQSIWDFLSLIHI